MKNIQDNKSKATLLQQHLEKAGFKLTRSSALNIIAKLEGYRSHTVAKRGISHSEHSSVNYAPVLYSGDYLHPAVQESYVRHQGKHCPYCGSHAIYDAMDSRADMTLWDVRMACHECTKQWFAVYRLVRIEGVAIRPNALAELLDGHHSCGHCGYVEVKYSTFMPGPQGYQMATCLRCHQTCMHVYALTEMAEVDPFFEDGNNEESPRYFVSEGWGHIFEPRISDDTVRFVFDTSSNSIIAMQILNHGKWIKATPAMCKDVEDSLLNANPEAFDEPEEWDMQKADTLPIWAKSSVS